MNETLGRGYARIEAIRAARGEPPSGGARPDNATPPEDVNNITYITLFMSGVVFLMPFNSFIMAVDYFQHHYPNSTIMFDMSTVYIATAFVAVIANNMLLEIFSYNTRITFGILVSLSTMLFVAICNIAWDSFSLNVSYTINLIAIGVVAFGCTVQQASYYGFTSCLPPRYTQIVMVGESAAGFWVSFDRMATKFSFRQPNRSTFIFFAFSIFIMLVHSMMHHYMMLDPFTKYYLKLTEDSRKKIVLEPREDAELMDPDGTESYGVLKLQTSPPSANSAPSHNSAGDIETSKFSFANPVYSPTATSAPILPTVSIPAVTPNQRTSYKVEDVIISQPERPTTWRAIKYGFTARWMVAQAIYPYMVSIGLAYFVTLALYPGIASEVRSCYFGTWMPILLMSTFNLFDLLGKMAGTWPYEWSRSQLLMASGLRLLLVPFFLLCASPRSSPHIKGDVYPFLFSVILGFTNGLFGSIPMVIAPSRVSREHREIAGNIMTLSYNVGLMSGSLVSYLLLNMLGPAVDPCSNHYPTGPLPTLPTMPTTTTTAAPPSTTSFFNLTNTVNHVH